MGTYHPNHHKYGIPAGHHTQNSSKVKLEHLFAEMSLTKTPRLFLSPRKVCLQKSLTTPPPTGTFVQWRCPSPVGSRQGTSLQKNPNNSKTVPTWETPFQDWQPWKGCSCLLTAAPCVSTSKCSRGET